MALAPTRKRFGTRPLLSVAVGVSLAACGTTSASDNAVQTPETISVPTPPGTRASTTTADTSTASASASVSAAVTEAPAEIEGVAASSLPAQPYENHPRPVTSAALRPRLMPSGRPACGNVASRDPPCEK